MCDKYILAKFTSTFQDQPIKKNTKALDKYFDGTLEK